MIESSETSELVVRDVGDSIYIHELCHTNEPVISSCDTTHIILGLIQVNEVSSLPHYDG